jgi:serine/threonine protein kinase
MMKKGSNNVYIIDFGLVEKIGSQRKRFVGTPYYSSNNHLKGGTVRRCDDLESLIYILQYLIKGELPWPRKLPIPHKQNTIDE